MEVALSHRKRLFQSLHREVSLTREVMEGVFSPMAALQPLRQLAWMI